MVVSSILGRVSAQAARLLGTSAGRRTAAAAGGGALAGTAVDDVPFIGPRVDPTESPGGSAGGLLGFGGVLSLVVAVVLAGGMFLMVEGDE